MTPGATSVTGLLKWGLHQAVVRNIGAVLVIKGHNSTMAASQVLQEEWNNAKPFKSVPGPKPLPVVGNIWRFFPFIGSFPSDILQAQYLLRKTYGNIVKLAGIPGRNDMVFLFDPNDIEKMFRNEGPWPIRDSIKCVEYYRMVTRKDLFEGAIGSLISQGEEWQTFRSKVNQTMMQPKSTKIYVAPIDAVASDFIKRMKMLRDDKQEMPDNFINELFKWALESIVYIALDTRMGCLDGELDSNSEPQKMIDAVQGVFEGMYKLDIRFSPWKHISTPAWRNFVKHCDCVTDTSLKYIHQAMERLKNLPKDSDRELTVLEKLLAGDDPKTAVVMAVDMMTAGVDTTSYSSAIALYFLAKNPEKQQKLFEEILRFLPEKDQPVTSNILNDLKYLKACVKESMRLAPIAGGHMRKLTKDLVLSNYRISKGTDAITTNLIMCRMEEHFPQADKFIPERWLRSEDGGQPESKMTHPFVFMPFGFGPRMCLGRRFAELEMDTLLTKIIRNFSVEYNYGEMKFQSKILYTPVSPLKFRFVDRE